jgi:hypothetical protein
MKKLLFISLLFIAIPVFADSVDNLQTNISTTSASVFGYPCDVDGFYVYNGSSTAQTVIIYDSTTEVFRCHVGASSDVDVTNFKKKIKTSLKATSSNENDGDKNVKIHVNIK